MSTQLVAAPEELLIQQLLEQSEQTFNVSGAGQELEARLLLATEMALIQTEDQNVVDLARAIFDQILRVFDRLSLIEGNLHKLDTLQENLSILDVLQFEIRYLIEFIDDEVIAAEGINERLRDVFDGIRYGISHDLKRVFERELLTDIREQSTPVVYGKILHAHGLLSNCFQQSMITLLQVLNPTIDPVHLFNDFEERLRQSLVLCNDLSSLMRVVRQAERESSAESLREVVHQAIEFRDGSMQYLMYRDWRGYERLALALITCIESNLDAKDLLHQFNCYLEVLYGHVKMRAVLRDMFPSSSEPAEDV